MKNIIEQLKKGILTAPPVLNSSLVSVKNWKRAQYIILSEIISENLSKSAFLQGAKRNELGTTFRVPHSNVFLPMIIPILKILIYVF